MDKQITVWSVVAENGNKLIHNHIEDGWVNSDYPLPKSPEYTIQSSWKNMKWDKKFAYLCDGIVI